MTTENDNPTTAMAMPEQGGAFAPVRGYADVLARPGAFETAWRLSRVLAASGIVPKHFAGKPEACFVAIMQANELRENVITLMSSMQVVHGTPGFAAKYMLARLNASGRIKGPVRYREHGKPRAADYGVTALATDAETGEEVNFMVDMEMARAEGWVKNPKYKTMPHVMLRYRAITFLVRMYYPEVMMGYSTVEEIQDMQAADARPSAPVQRVSAASALGLPEPVPVQDADIEDADRSEPEPIPLSQLPSLMAAYEAQVDDPWTVVEGCGGVRTREIGQQSEAVQRRVAEALQSELAEIDG